MFKRSIIATIMTMVMVVTSVLPVFAVNNSTKSNPAKFVDGSKVYCDIWLGTGMSFGVAGSTNFVPIGTKKNTRITNTTKIAITGLGCSIGGLALQGSSSETSEVHINTLGQTFAGASGTVATDQSWYLYITGSSSGSVNYDGTSRSSGATVTKWI